MASYNYIVGLRDGATQKGHIDAKDIESAVADLRKKGFFVLNIKKSSQVGMFDIDAIKNILESRLGPEINESERLMFTSHLASMLKTGVPIVEAISTFLDKKSSGRRKRMFEAIIADIESGSPLSKALSKYPRSFSPIYANIISSGESMGTLGETLSYLGNQLKKDHELAGRVKSALIYPAVISVIMVIVLVFILVAVVPKILTFAENSGGELPFATRMLITLTSVLTTYGVFILIALAVLFSLFLRIIRTKKGKKKFDAVVMILPIFGELIRRFNLARFARLLGSFYHYGIPLPTAFSILETALPTTQYQDIAHRLSDRISHGDSLSIALEEESDKYFPQIMVRVLRSAEKTATVDDALSRLAEYYEEELDGTLKNLTTIIEPVMILVLGVAVTGIALAVIVPIYQITSNFK